MWTSGAVALLVACCTAVATASAAALNESVIAAPYVLSANMSGPSFFDAFDFFTDADPTNGYVNYVSRAQAQAEGLIDASAADGNVYIGADSRNVASGRGRDSVRLQSKERWTTGLFIMDLLHMPTGCATWYVRTYVRTYGRDRGIHTVTRLCSSDLSPRCPPPVLACASRASRASR
jgi:hypothetical protein